MTEKENAVLTFAVGAASVAVVACLALAWVTGREAWRSWRSCGR